ncbi:MarR family winged helix-turn-helix transcriptional regulator [Variovorax sp. H27-G14]|uniref:MarR family winged helix-turn-helix transcriptional regulator n=1 Tax=Variovorax sp. H27-G14 TaxID=3111914 RepID=UPI0038FCAB30
MPSSPKSAAAKGPSAVAPQGKPDRLDARMLEALVGYNARRAWLVVSAFFAERMAPYGLKQIDFSVLSLLAHNPGATSRQLCNALDILPPNLVSLVATLDSRGLIERRPHPHDGRAVGLHLTPAGDTLVREAEQAVVQLEADASAKLSARERETLIKLLQKMYL